eukprot:SAG31_NODE_488_length_14964_cov_56.443458_10_plen_113_part_00
MAGQPAGFFSGARAYHDPLPDAFCGCDRCADEANEYRDLHEATELLRLKSQQGHDRGVLSDWTGPLHGIPKLNSRQGLLPGVDPLDDSSDDDGDYWGDNLGNYVVDEGGDDY